MGDANQEIAFGTVATGVVCGLVAGGLTRAIVPDNVSAFEVGGVVGLASGAIAAVYLWRVEMTPGSWANPIVVESLPAPAATTQNPAPSPSSTSVLSNTVPPTLLGTSVAIAGTLGTIGAAVAAVGLLYELRDKSRTKRT